MKNSSDPFSVLDDYLSRLQAGETPDAEAVLRELPELASALEVLAALEGLAPPLVASPDTNQDDSDEESGPVSALGGLPCRFGQYELLDEIGRGGMGVVYRAQQSELDRIVAVKMILASHLASPEHVRRFHAEAKAAARVQHPNIVHIHDVGQVHGQHYFAMEYVEGESLAKRIARDPLDPASAARLLASVARAVDHLHRQGIVHRDLKPLNILLDTSGEPFLADFGLAKLFEPGSEQTATGVIAGSLPYMAPEQANPQGGQIGPATDVYGLGAILYELLTGQPPFGKESGLHTLLDVVGREPQLPRQLNPRIPRGLELICLKCLAKSPADRYGSAAELADDLERFARGETLRLRPPTVGQRVWGWVRREPALASRLIALTLFYVAFLVIDGLRRQFGAATGAESGAFHLKVVAIIAFWASASVVCQRLLDSRRWSLPARYLWGALDSLLLLAVLLVADGVASPLIVGYPLLIVGSGLWFRVRFVWFMTALSVVSYGLLTLEFYRTAPQQRPLFDVDPDRHVINILALLVLGAIVAYLVDRLRTLTNLYRR